MTRPAVRTGLDCLVAGECSEALREARSGLILHPASVTADLGLAVDALLDARFNLGALFGPQHGVRGEKQDNMIESGHSMDCKTGLAVHSLYSDVRKPAPAMLEPLDVVFFDLQDVGVRVYTFVWTMALAMEACAEAGVRFVVLDRPNPVGGERVEGPMLKPGFESFVGLHPIPLRHGLTAGELALWLNAERGIGCDLEVVPMEGWRRSMTWNRTGLPYVLPSPNLPTAESCAVYPGMVLVEGTNLSEGRGTTKPFELIGAPYLDGSRFASAVAGALGGSIPGATLRPCAFEPTFQKHAGEVCGGVQIHVTDEALFEPVDLAVAMFRAARDLAHDRFGWRPPPYEYEETLMPIDILWGHDGLRAGIDEGATVASVMADCASECADFEASARPHRLYP